MKQNTIYPPFRLAKMVIALFFLLPFGLMAQEDIKHYNEGVKAHNAQNYEAAIACYKKCLSINPDNKDAINNLGIVYYNQSLNYYNKKDYDKCIEYCKTSLKYDPKNANSYYMIGTAQKEQKKYNESIATYQSAVKLSDKPADIYAAIAWVYNDLHDNKNKLVYMKKAVELAPKQAEYQFHCGKFKQEVSTEEFKTAIENYNKAIELKADYTEAYTERAAFYMTFQQFDKALPDLEKAKELGADVGHLIEAAKFELEDQKK